MSLLIGFLNAFFLRKLITISLQSILSCLQFLSSSICIICIACILGSFLGIIQSLCLIRNHITTFCQCIITSIQTLQTIIAIKQIQLILLLLCKDISICLSNLLIKFQTSNIGLITSDSLQTFSVGCIECIIGTSNCYDAIIQCTMKLSILSLSLINSSSQSIGYLVVFNLQQLGNLSEIKVQLDF